MADEKYNKASLSGSLLGTVIVQGVRSPVVQRWLRETDTVPLTNADLPFEQAMHRLVNEPASFATAEALDAAVAPWWATRTDLHERLLLATVAAAAAARQRPIAAPWTALAKRWLIRAAPLVDDTLPNELRAEYLAALGTLDLLTGQRRIGMDHLREAAACCRPGGRRHGTLLRHLLMAMALRGEATLLNDQLAVADARYLDPGTDRLWISMIRFMDAVECMRLDEARANHETLEANRVRTHGSWAGMYLTYWSFYRLGLAALRGTPLPDLRAPALELRPYARWRLRDLLVTYQALLAGGPVAHLNAARAVHQDEVTTSTHHLSCLPLRLGLACGLVDEVQLMLDRRSALAHDTWIDAFFAARVLRVHGRHADAAQAFARASAGATAVRAEGRLELELRLSQELGRLELVRMVSHGGPRADRPATDDPPTPLPTGTPPPATIGPPTSTSGGSDSDHSASGSRRRPTATALPATATVATATPGGGGMPGGGGGQDLHELIGASPLMVAVRTMLRQILPGRGPILLTGEVGTGKTLVANLLHRCSPRRTGRLVTLSCASLQESLIESELFGSQRGAWQGAVARPGLLASARDGTLLLEEVGEAPPRLQSILVQLLEHGRWRRLGATDDEVLSCRLVFSTRHDLGALVAAGTLREDLYWRLSQTVLALPALRHRPEDLPQLIEHFLRQGRTADTPMSLPTVSRDAIAALRQRPWPGNLRELHNLVEALRLRFGDRPQWTRKTLTEWASADGGVRRTPTGAPPRSSGSGPLAALAGNGIDPNAETGEFAPHGPDGEAGETDVFHPLTSASGPLPAVRPAAATTGPAAPSGPIDDSAGEAVLLAEGQTMMRRLERLRDLFRRHRKLTRKEVARLLGCAPGSATSYLRMLMDEGLVRKVEPSPAPVTHYFEAVG